MRRIRRRPKLLVRLEQAEDPGARRPDRGPRPRPGAGAGHARLAPGRRGPVRRAGGVSYRSHQCETRLARRVFHRLGATVAVVVPEVDLDRGGCSRAASGRRPGASCAPASIASSSRGSGPLGCGGSIERRAARRSTSRRERELAASASIAISPVDCAGTGALEQVLLAAGRARASAAAVPGALVLEQPLEHADRRVERRPRRRRARPRSSSRRRRAARRAGARRCGVAVGAEVGAEGRPSAVDAGLDLAVEERQAVVPPAARSPRPRTIISTATSEAPGRGRGRTAQQRAASRSTAAARRSPPAPAGEQAPPIQ